MKRLATILLLTPALWAAAYQRILVPEGSHSAVQAAAKMLAARLALPESAIQPGSKAASGEILLRVAAGAKHDGYQIVFEDGRATINGARPRSLLFAAGDYPLWKDRTSGTYLREPSFAVRTSQFENSRTVPENVAELGVNVLIWRPNPAITLRALPEVWQRLKPEEQELLDRQARAGAERDRAFMQQCKDADVACYAFLYGNDFRRWSEPLYAAAVDAYPNAKGTPGTKSFEKATLCPSDALTWKLVGGYVKEFLEQTQADGLYATFWDAYGINCQCDRCRRSGLNKFPNQIHRNVQEYDGVTKAAGKKLVIRTWSSGVPHWLRDEYVHAPGYDGFGGAGVDLWSRVIRELPADIYIQTKVYHADCQPDARFSTLLGKAAPHTEIAEYQIAGQTVGRFYFPASSVDYNAQTMRKARELVGAEGGVNVFPGGTMQTDYALPDDIVNGINLYAWRELSWDVKADVDKIWNDWAVSIYGARAAPHIIRALKLSEEAVNRTFSTLGMGSSTNSDFAGNIARRETLLMYTNRYYLPEYARFLEPTKENIARVAEEKAAALKKMDEMSRELELARPYLKPEQAAELATRFDWLKEFAICSRDLDESLWRYRYLRHLSTQLTTDPEQIKHLAANYDDVKEHAARLFRFDPALKFSCYRTTLGGLRRKPDLGSPLPLMRELYEKSRDLVEGAAGPEVLPSEWRRP